MTLTKALIIENIRKDCEFDKAQSAKLFETLLETIKSTVE